MTTARDRLDARAAASVTGGIDELADELAQRLAELLADRLATWFGGIAPARTEPLVDAAEVARILGKTRSWVYEHAGELGAVRLGEGPKPRLGFARARVAERLAEVGRPESTPLATAPRPKRRTPRSGRTASGAPLLSVRSRGT